MQIKIFSIPVLDGAAEEAAMNKFLNAHKILTIESSLCTLEQTAFWTFCVKYLKGANRSDFQKKDKIDYKEVLSAEHFAVFSRLREIRKAIAQEDQVPAYVVFTNAELAEIAKLPEIKLTTLKSVEGVGEKKIELYASRIITALNEKSR